MAIDAVLTASDEETRKECVNKLKHLSAYTLTDTSLQAGYTARTRERLTAYANAHHASYSPTTTSKPCPKSTLTPRQLANRIHSTTSQGNPGKAARALDAEEIVPAVGADLDTLHRLHPHEPSITEPVPNVEVPFRMHHLTKALEDLPKGTAPGMSGMTFAHVRDACSSSNRCKQAMFHLIQAMLTNTLPGLDGLLDCDGIAFRKHNKGVRPIAISEVLYRLASKCAIAMVVDAEVPLAPLQHAFKVSGGTSILAHALQASVEADPSTVILSADFSNAFNTLKRASIL